MEPVVTELSICSGKLNTSVDFTTHHSVPEKVKFYTFYYYYYYYYPSKLSVMFLKEFCIKNLFYHKYQK